MLIPTNTVFKILAHIALLTLTQILGLATKALFSEFHDLTDFRNLVKVLPLWLEEN
jgi:hypothetical protein